MRRIMAHVPTDPTRTIIKGIAVATDTPFEMPWLTHLKGQLWIGGVIGGDRLPDRFTYVVSMHNDPYERWEISPRQRRMQYTLGDHGDEQDFDDVIPAVLAVEYFLQLVEPNEDVLVHCQMGLNRSALIAGIVLRRQGMDGAAAVDLLRATRSPAVLENAKFEAIVRAWPDVEKV